MSNITLPSISADGSLKRYLSEIGQFPILKQDEEYTLAKNWLEHEDIDAAHTLVTSHLRLVAKIAMGYRGYGLPISDLISEGNIGLMKAVKRFDPDKGFRLATYATWNRIKKVMAPGALDSVTKELIYIAVSVVNGCEYCVHSHTGLQKYSVLVSALCINKPLF